MQTYTIFGFQDTNRNGVVLSTYQLPTPVATAAAAQKQTREFYLLVEFHWKSVFLHGKPLLPANVEREHCCRRRRRLVEQKFVDFFLSLSAFSCCLLLLYTINEKCFIIDLVYLTIAK